MRLDLDLRLLITDKDRHGNVRYYVRRKPLPKIRIKEKPGTPEFMLAYSAAVDRLEAPGGSGERSRTGTVGWLAQLYFDSPHFQGSKGKSKLITGLDRKSQSNRRSVIEECLREPLKPGGKLIIRDVPLHRFEPSHIRLLRDRKADLPGAANNRKKYLSAMFKWALEEAAEKTGLKTNPCRDVKGLQYSSSGFHTWTVPEVEQYRAFHAPGTKARLALELLLLLGVRKEDVVTIGRQHLSPAGTVRGGAVRLVPLKTQYLGGARLDASEKPILDPLADVIEAQAVMGDLHFLVTDWGRPFTANGFGNRFREWCNQAGLPGCTAHGLRKAGAAIAAVNGATLPQLMAIYDWETEEQALVYIRAANRKRMAREGMPLLIATSADAVTPDAGSAENKARRERVPPRVPPKQKQRKIS